MIRAFSLTHRALPEVFLLEPVSAFLTTRRHTSDVVSRVSGLIQDANHWHADQAPAAFSMHFRKGVFAEHEKNFTAARNHFQDAINALPQDADPLYRSVAEQSMSNSQRQLEIIEKSCSSDTPLKPFLGQTGVVCALIGLAAIVFGYQDSTSLLRGPTPPANGSVDS